MKILIDVNVESMIELLYKKVKSKRKSQQIQLPLRFKKEKPSLL